MPLSWLKNTGSFKYNKKLQHFSLPTLFFSQINLSKTFNSFVYHFINDFFLYLASLSQEKAEIESKFLAERKRYKKEKDELSSEINKLKTNEQSLK